MTRTHFDLFLRPCCCCCCNYQIVEDFGGENLFRVQHKEMIIMRFEVVLVLLMFAVSVRSNPIDANQLQITPAQRGIWDIVGNWIQGSDWFPIQINIPQTFGSIGNGIMTFANGIVQRIPFINNRPDMVRPRPHNYMIVVPLHKDNNFLNEEVLTYP